MIILRKINTGSSSTVSSSSVYVAGNLIGDKNGINKVFATEYEYETDRITIFYNGQALHSPYDFIQTGSNEITFKYIIPGYNDVLKTTYQRVIAASYTDINLTYNNGVWESTASSYTEVPSNSKVYLNGIKQDNEYYQIILNSGKIEVSFGFYTNSNDWVNVEAPVSDDQDLVYNSGTWVTTTTSGYTSISSVLQVYVNGKKEDSNFYNQSLVNGDIEITFNFPTSNDDWINIDIPTTTYTWLDIDMVYNSGFWRTPTSEYTETPSIIKVFLNGIKQNPEDYVVSLSSNKIQINFEVSTNSSDWVNILIVS